MSKNIEKQTEIKVEEIEKIPETEIKIEESIEESTKAKKKSKEKIEVIENATPRINKLNQLK
jgi:hypothetical protein